MKKAVLVLTLLMSTMSYAQAQDHGSLVLSCHSKFSDLEIMNNSGEYIIETSTHDNINGSEFLNGYYNDSKFISFNNIESVTKKSDSISFKLVGVKSLITLQIIDGRDLRITTTAQSGEKALAVVDQIKNQLSLVDSKGQYFDYFDSCIVK